jgi:hypothetical protein
MFDRLRGLARSIGSKAVNALSEGVKHVKHMGSTVHNLAGKVPIFGDALQKGLEMLYEAKLPIVNVSAKNVVDGVDAVAKIGQNLLGDNQERRAEAVERIRNIGMRGLRSEVPTIRRGAEAINRISRVFSQ